MRVTPWSIATSREGTGYPGLATCDVQPGVACAQTFSRGLSLVADGFHAEMMYLGQPELVPRNC